MTQFQSLVMVMMAMSKVTKLLELIKPVDMDQVALESLSEDSINGQELVAVIHWL